MQRIITQLRKVEESRTEMQFRLLLWLCGAGALMSLPAHAQRSGAMPSPADADARVPEVTYQSAFAGYARYREEKVAPWRDVNEAVARAGGHVGIFSSARGAPDAAQPMKVSPAPGAAQGRQPEQKK
jgi:hypothetical protein